MDLSERSSPFGWPIQGVGVLLWLPALLPRCVLASALKIEPALLLAALAVGVTLAGLFLDATVLAVIEKGLVKLALWRQHSRPEREAVICEDGYKWEAAQRVVWKYPAAAKELQQDAIRIAAARAYWLHSLLAGLLWGRLLLRQGELLRGAFAFTAGFLAVDAFLWMWIRYTRAYNNKVRVSTTL